MDLPPEAVEVVAWTRTSVGSAPIVREDASGEPLERLEIELRDRRDGGRALSGALPR